MTDETTPPDPGAAPPPAAPPAAWYGDNAELKGFAELKGWDSPDKAVGAYRQLETFLGADKAGRGVVWPKDDADTEGWKAIHAKLGVPESPDAYKLPVPEGGSDAFAKAIAPELHKLGISAKQAEGLAAFVNNFEKSQLEAFTTAQQTKIAADLEQFKGEMGAGFAPAVELAKRAASSLKVSDEQYAALEESLGLKGTVELFASIGKKLGEDTFTGGDSKPTAGDLSPAAAKLRMEQLTKDQSWMTKVMSGDTVALEEKERLNANMLGLTLADYRKAKAAA